jgi:hypothetical protein
MLGSCCGGMYVITLGSTASGKARRLKRARAGQTTSVVNGSSRVRTKMANVEHDTKKGAVDHVILFNAFMAPILRKVFSS